MPNESLLELVAIGSMLDLCVPRISSTKNQQIPLKKKLSIWNNPAISAQNQRRECINYMTNTFQPKQTGPHSTPRCNLTYE